jgi:sigma-B regulation protein RsbU (phosphoserine phosphatase)
MEEMKQIPREIVELTWPLDDRSILDLEVEDNLSGSGLILNFHLPRETRTKLRAYLNKLTETKSGKLLASWEEAIEIGELPRYQLVFQWNLDNTLPVETLASLHQQLYTGLGLSRSDIRKLTELDLTEILEKIREQQEELHEQKAQIQSALSKIERDLEAAREAQMHLLPKELIGVDDIEFSARFIPSQYVSGDIYNIFRLDEHNIGAYHIDISGHGVPAALFSVSLSQMLNTNISSRNLLKIPASVPPYYRINPPDAVFSTLDEEHSFGEFDIFFTMIYMVINLEKKRISYGRAGHNPPIILRANGEVIISDEGGLPIGWGLPRDDSPTEVDLQPGDRIYLYSDGISDVFNENEETFSQERIVSVLRKNFEKKLEEGLDMLIEELRVFSGRDTFEDDVSIIGLALNN